MSIYSQLYWPTTVNEHLWFMNCIKCHIHVIFNMIEHESDLIMGLLDVLLLYLHFSICHLLIHNFWMLKVLRQTEDTIVCTCIFLLTQIVRKRQTKLSIYFCELMCLWYSSRTGSRTIR